MKLRMLCRFAVMAVIALAVTTCDRSDERPSITSSPTPPAPIIKFEEPTFDFGHIGFGETTIKHRFLFWNKGDAPLHIYSVRPTCACTISKSFESSLRPNEEGYIEVSLAVGSAGLQEKSGLIEKNVYVESNDPLRPIAKLTLRGRREKHHFYYPSAVVFGPTYIQTSQSEVLYYLPSNRVMTNCKPAVSTTADYLKARIEKRVFESMPLDASLREVTQDFPFALSDSAYPREGYLITVDLLPSAPAGQFFHYLILETGDPVDSRIMIRVYGDIREPLEISPRRLFLGLVTDDRELRRTITVRTPDGKSFNIHSVDSEIDFIIPDSRRVSPAEWKIDLRLKSEKFKPGDFRGLLTISTDFPTMEKFTIGVYGRAKETGASASFD